MYLRCAYCRLKLSLPHFQAGTTVLTSLCDICQQRGLAVADFANVQVATLAKARGWSYLGRAQQLPIQEQKTLTLTKNQRRTCLSLIRSFDALTNAWQQPQRRRRFYTALLTWQDDPQRQPFSGNLPQDLTSLGCQIEGIFDKNKVDYQTRQRIREKFHYTCQYCGRYGDSVDHKEPVVRSNDNDLDNLTLSCRECNKLKGDMPYALFKKWNAELGDVLPRLVAAQRTLQRLQAQKEQIQRRLAAEQHLQQRVVSPQTNALRAQIKVLQGLLDGQMSDYQELIRLRHDYLVSHYQLWLLQQPIQHVTDRDDG